MTYLWSFIDSEIMHKVAVGNGLKPTFQTKTTTF